MAISHKEMGTGTGPLIIDWDGNRNDQENEYLHEIL